MADGSVIQADGYPGDIVMVGAEAQGHRRIGSHSAKRHTVQAIPRIMPQAIILDVVIVTVPGADRENVRYGVVAEGHLGIVGWHIEWNVRSARYATLTIIHIPAFVERHFAFIITGWQCSRLERVNPIAIRVL